MNPIQDQSPTRSQILVSVAQAILIFGVVLLTFSFFINAAPLAGTEAHRAIPAHQMLQSGNWTIPSFWGVPYLAKPPLHYWLLALSEATFQTDAVWVYRFPSVLSAALTATILFFFTRRHFPAPAPFIAGLSFLTLFALWSQNIKADIDANHTLAVTVATLGIIELGLKKHTACYRSAIFWTSLTTLAFAAVLLLKGPAGLPVILGAILGPAFLLKKQSFIRRPHIYLSLALGTIIFTGWILTVRFNLNADNTTLDKMGLAEVWRNFTTFDLKTILATLSLPAILFAYTLPHSAITLLAVRRRPAAERENHSPEGIINNHNFNDDNHDPQQITQIIVATLIAATALAMFARLANPRYMYIAFPLLCPIVGLQLAHWMNKHPIIPSSDRRLFATLIVIIAAATPVVSVVLAISTRITYQLPIPIWMIASIVAILILSPLAIRWTIHEQTRSALITLTLLIITFFPIFAYSRTQARHLTSSYQAGLALRQIVGPHAVVYSSKWIRNGPELPFYANVDVVYRLKGQFTPETTPANAWVLFQDGEYQSWVDAIGEEWFEEITVLPTRKQNAIIARFLGCPDKILAPVHAQRP